MRTLKELIPYTKIKNFTLEYANRLSRHNKVCSNYEQHALAKQWRAREISKYEDSNHLIEPNHQVVYCEMQKCASSNWRNTISMLQSINKNSPNKTAWEYTKENDRTKRDTNWKTLSLENNPERFPDNHRDKRWGHRAKFAPYRIRTFINQLKILQGYLLSQSFVFYRAQIWRGYPTSYPYA